MSLGGEFEPALEVSPDVIDYVLFRRYPFRDTWGFEMEKRSFIFGTDEVEAAACRSNRCVSGRVPKERDITRRTWQTSRALRIP